MYQLLLLWAAGAGAMLVFGWLNSRKRSRDLRDIAPRLGLHYLGDNLPRSIALEGTALRKASVKNVMDGTRNGVRVIAFDFRIGHGRGSWSRTALAARTSRDVFGAARFITEFKFERSADWTIVYEAGTVPVHRGGLMPVTELEAWLEGIGSLVS